MKGSQALPEATSYFPHDASLQILHGVWTHYVQTPPKIQLLLKNNIRMLLQQEAGQQLVPATACRIC